MRRRPPPSPVYLAGEARSQRAFARRIGGRIGQEEPRPRARRGRPAGRRADAPAACFARPSRADCVDDACRGMMPGRRGSFLGSIRRDPNHDKYGQGGLLRHALRDSLVGTDPRFWAAVPVLRRRPHAGGRGLRPRRRRVLHEQEFRRREMRRARAGRENRSGPQRCDVLLKYFGTMDYGGEHARTPPCDFAESPTPATTCGATRRPARSTTSARIRGAGGTASGTGRTALGDEVALRPQLVPGRPAEASALAGLAEEPAHGRAPAHPGLRRGHRRRRLLPRAARGEEAWDEAWLYKDDHYSNTDEYWGHPWDNFWASTRAPRRWRGWTARRRPRRPTRARGTWRASSTAAASGPAGRRATSSATTPSSSRSSRPP